MLGFLSKKRKIATVTNDHRIYAQLATLIKLQFQAKGFSFLPGQPVNSILTGRHSSKLRGRGLNFEELRHYRAGDDIRTMDWKVTNRTKKPHVRVFTEERERNVVLLVDQRVSMFFGSEEKMKSVAAAEAAALIAWRVLASGDRVGAVVINDQSIVHIPPERSKSNVIKILSKIVEFNQQLKVGRSSHNKRLQEAIDTAARTLSHDALLILISDGSGWNQQTTDRIRRISQHNDIISLKIFDPAEEQLPDIDHLVVSDGKLQVEVTGNPAKLRENFQQQYDNNLGLIRTELKKYGVPLIPIDTIRPVQEQLIKALGGIRR
ncbi:DUF58 domain-containing protein [Oceanicoccus sagamiensis]|uniref:MoxR protein n=1 Tax=Oceanicoccus sagamiensis TaxID=716816 RepID=A0A1X9NPE7_9GAMM|nr:DUF58 domain-containing protein [Oceanicoccus sagamiensis]ARN75763.1 MoxR protein [Oceanicoccus sagamiensis]